MRVKVNVVGRGGLKAKLAIAQRQIRGGGAQALIGFLAERFVRQHFQQSRDPEGRPWAPLKYRRGRPLVDTGVLMNSIGHRAAGGRIEVFSRDRRAAIHNYGGRTSPTTIYPKRAEALAFRNQRGQLVFAKKVDHPGSRIPARKFMGLGRAEQDQIKVAVEKWAVAKLRAAGLRVRER